MVGVAVSWHITFTGHNITWQERVYGYYEVIFGQQIYINKQTCFLTESVGAVTSVTLLVLTPSAEWFNARVLD